MRTKTRFISLLLALVMSFSLITPGCSGRLGLLRSFNLIVVEGASEHGDELDAGDLVIGSERAVLETGYDMGMADGKFHGEESMTRAQACTVIMRMLKLINSYNPGDKTFFAALAIS